MKYGKITPRQYQIEAHQATTDHIRKYDGPAFVDASVGAGKSLLIAMIGHRCQEVNIPMLVLSRQSEIIEQNAEEAWGIGVKNSIFSASAGVKSTAYPIIFGTEGTVARALDKELADYVPSILAIDEVHHVAHDEPESQYMKIITEFQRRNPKLRIIGYTGSPFRGTEPILGEFWKKRLYQISTETLVERGFLVPCVFGTGHDDVKYDLSQFAAQYNEGTQDFTAAELKAMEKEILNQGTQTQKIIMEVMHLTADRNCVMITGASKKHLEECAKYLPTNSYGIITDSTGVKARREILTRAKDGDLKYLLQVGCLTTGLNIPLIDTIVILRKIGSLTLLVQLIGRGLRTLKDYQIDAGIVKDDCIARDSEVLTDKGLVKIQDVTLDHKVWDGVSFVSHKGAVCRGIKDVIEHDGVIATPDHKVMTNEGWMQISAAKHSKRRIVRTGDGGKPIRITGDNISICSGKVEQPSCGGKVPGVWGNIHEQLKQHEKEAGQQGLQVLPLKDASSRTEMALQEMPSPERPLRESKQQPLPPIRGKGDTVQISERESCCTLDSSKHAAFKEGFATGQNRQQRPLRAGESEVGSSCRKREQHGAFNWSEGEVYCVQGELPTSEICGRNFNKNASHHGGERDIGEMGSTFKKTKREVWDILSAGPLQRFTANGRLVHNCLVLDYSDTMRELGQLYHNPILEEAEKQRARREGDVITCPKCYTVNSMFARRCVGQDQSSKDGRCEHFWQSRPCTSCGTENDIAARECRDCHATLIDPNANLLRKHYTDDDLKPVLRFDMRPTSNGEGVLVEYELPDGERATEVFWPASEKQLARTLWRTKFVFKHINCPQWRKRALAMKNAGQICQSKAIFSAPAFITHRLNDKKRSIIHRKVFSNGREETENETQLTE